MGQKISRGIKDHQDLERFSAYPSDIAAKDQIDLMARCWFSLTANRIDPIEHEFTDTRSNRIEKVRITGSPEHGIATIHDQDLIIFAVSQYIEAKRVGLSPSRRIAFTPYQFFTWMGKAPNGQAYARLRDTLHRLKTTNVETTLRSTAATHRGRMKQFSWISEWDVKEEYGEIRGVEVVLAEWLFESIQECNVLTLDKRYFEIAGSVERWLYLYARKATGNPAGIWKETFKSLYKKSAAQQAYKHYANTLRKLIANNTLPGLKLESAESMEGKDMLVMKREIPRSVVDKNPTQLALIELSPLEEAWENVLISMEAYFGVASVNSWLRKLTLVGFDAGILSLRAPTPFIAIHVKTQFGDRLIRALKTLGFDARELVIDSVSVVKDTKRSQSKASHL